MQMLSAGGLLAYGLTITFASFDWLMSLEPHWFSTIYGVLIIGGQGLSAMAFLIIVLVWLSRRPPLDAIVGPAHFHDLGNLMLAFVMLWAYFSFSQYLIIWSGNLPEEIAWYLHRLQTGWRFVGLALVLFHFVVPFCLLLSRAVKREAQMIVKVARRHPGPPRRSVLADRAGVSPRPASRSAGSTSCCRCRCSRSGSAASSGSFAAARFCRCTIRNSTRRSAGFFESAGDGRRAAWMERDRPDNPEVHHETSDVNIRAVLGFGLGLIVVAFVLHVGIWLLFMAFAAREARRMAPQYPRSPPARRAACRRSRGCRRTRARTCEDLRAAEDAILDRYGWVDKNAGVVRIPIDEAMKLTVERGIAGAGRQREKMTSALPQRTRRTEG